METTVSDEKYYGVFYKAVFSPSKLKNIVLIDVSNLTEKETPNPTPDIPIGDLEPGTYTLTANLYVPGDKNVVLNGVTAYITNTSVPPTVPVSMNAQLDVSENAKPILTVKSFNEIFTLQNIEDAENAHIISKDTVSGTFGSYTSRINGLKIELDDYSGIYNFTNCRQRPIIKDYDIEMSIQMKVEFNTAQKDYVDDGTSVSKVFRDINTGTSISVSTKDKDIASKLENASMNIEHLTEGKEVRGLKKLYDGNFTNAVYKCTLLDKEGNVLNLPENNSQVTLMFGEKYENPAVYKYDNGDWTEQKLANPEVAMLTSNTTGVFAITEETGAYRNIIFSGKDEETGISEHYYVSTRTGYNAGKFGVINGLKPFVETDQIGTRYYVGGFQSADDKLPYDWHYAGYSNMEVTIPYDETKNYYLVITDGENYSADKLDMANAEKDGDLATVEILSKNEGKYAEYNRKLRALGNAMLKTPTSIEETQWGTRYVENAYILATDKKVVGMPLEVRGKASNTNLQDGVSVTTSEIIYNGNIQGLSLDPEHLKLNGDYQAKDAGDYNLTVSPADGYIWVDGITSEKKYNWSIGKKNLRIEYKGEAIHLDETPKLKIEDFSTYFVSGENEDNAEGFVMPTLTAPEELEVGKRYSLKPSGGEAKNYYFNYCRGGLVCST